MKEKLNITAVSEPESIPSKDGKKFEKYTVKAGGKTFFVYSKRLAALLKPGETAEVEWDDTAYGTKITDVYIGGQSAPKGGGWKKEDKEYKADPAKILSMNQESAFRGTVELMTAKVIDPIQPLGAAAIAWALRMLQSESVETKAITQPHPPAKSPPDAPQEARQPVKEQSSTITPRKDLEATLFTQCNDLIRMEVWDKVELRNILRELGAKGETVKAALASLSDIDLLSFQKRCLDAIAEAQP